MWWLDRIKDTIIQSAHFDISDLDKAPFTERGGTDGAVQELGPEAAVLITALNDEVAA
jgi:type I restriction enzyme R subunit